MIFAFFVYKKYGEIMKTADLDYFQKLVELKSYKKTAEYFKRSQPTITAAIKRLNEEFGAKLIEQDSPRSPIKITAAGKVLYTRVNDFNLLMHITREEVNRAGSRKVSLGISPIVSSSWIAALLTDLREKDLIGNIVTYRALSKRLIRNLEMGEIEMGVITSFSPINNARFESVPLRTDKFQLIVSEQNPLAEKEQIDFSELKNEPFVSMYDQFIQRQVLNNYALHTKIKPHYVYLTDDIHVVLNLVKCNVGVSIVSSKMAASLPGIKAVDLTGILNMKMHLALTRRRDNTISDLQKEVEDAITAYAQKNTNL